MRVFVASWFFPPSTSSEGIVTYKLLRNSTHEYDVCSAQCSLWGYDQLLPIEATNIRSFSIDTESLETWTQKAICTFEQEHKKNPYDAIMTRTMPPESIVVGQQIKARYPEIPWIASLADPVSLNPYQVKDFVLDSNDLSENEQNCFLDNLKNGYISEANKKDPGLLHLHEMKETEDCAINQANALIFPCDTLKNYILGTRQRAHSYTIPHTFDPDLFPEQHSFIKTKDDKIVFTFLGSSDKTRSLKPIILALNRIRTTNPTALEKLKIRLIGNVPDNIQDLVFNFYLYDYVAIEPSISYLESLAVMAESPWLIHVDAKFDFLEPVGGSLFFAGKIADYLGTDSPILGITGDHSPASDIIKRAGGVCIDPEDINALADALVGITERTINPTVDKNYRQQYTAKNVATYYDQILERVVGGAAVFERNSWLPTPLPAKEKLVTICIPAYNVESYLDRCLFSLISCKKADSLEVLVVNDGSKDSTALIAQTYQDHYPTIVRVINKENGGHGSTINTALKQAKGRYFRVIDGDDWVDNNSFDSLLANIEEHSIDVDLISSNYYQVYLDDGHAVSWTKNGDSEYYKVFDFNSSDFSMEYFTMAAVMFKTSALREPAFKIQEHTFYVDVEYLLFPIPYTHSVLFAPEYIYRYAVGNADQSINRATFTKRYDHHDRVIRRMLTYYESHRGTMGRGQSEYMKSLFLRHLLQSHYLLSLVWDPDRTQGLDRAQDFDLFLQKTNPELWKLSAKNYPAVHTARKKGFSPNRIAQPESMDDGGKTFRSLFIRVIRRLKKTRLADSLASNETLRTAAHKVLPR